MANIISSHFKKATVGLAAAFLGAGLLPNPASAQTYGGQDIQGTVASINSTFDISVDDSNGYVDDVTLHQGTIINPTGLTLAPGMQVTIEGYNAGNTFDANEIDTPYQYEGPAPTPVFYGAGWWYPGYAYGYGPSFSLVIGGGRLERAPWSGHWYAHQPIPSGAYRGPVESNRQPVGAYRGSVGYRAPVPAERAPLTAARGPMPVARAPMQARAPQGAFARGAAPQARTLARAPMPAARAPMASHAASPREATRGGADHRRG